MTTNKPEVVAWRWRKPIVNDQGETVGATAWELGDAPEFLPWWTNEPLIRLSDYETLQAECETLRGLLDEIGRGCSRRVMPSEQTIASWAEAIDTALAAYRRY